MPSGVYKHHKNQGFQKGVCVGGGFKKGNNFGNKETGEKNANWKGNKVKYRALHQWVQKWKGSPKYCEDCGTIDLNKTYDWANVDHKYRRVLEDYIRMCRGCHRKYDKKS
jgi:hypothetical protein